MHLLVLGPEAPTMVSQMGPGVRDSGVGWDT